MKYLIAITMILFFIGCSAEKESVSQQVSTKSKVVIKEKIVKQNCENNDKKIIGAVELVQVVDVGVTKKARIDTGATTTSLDAQDIVLFERDGKKWVKFKFAGKKIEKKMVGIVSIKRHGAKDTKRPSIMIRLALGDTTRNVKVTLADRSKFTYPILIGRNFLKDMFMVDVGRKMGPAPKEKGKK